MVAINMPHIDDRPLTFGKHKGSTPNELMETDPKYLVWLYENIKPQVVSKDLYMNAADVDIDGDGEYGVNGYYG